ncbi:MAG: hypothetical protein NC177_10060 [Ruminococcus flavefaciens]|nr:hypothetical protein [Ruminococcus flavefaciens]
MKKLIKFLKDTWKTLLVIFIVTATLLHVLIFDGSIIPFAVSVISCLFILFLNSLKSLTDTVKMFYILKKEGTITGKDKKENTFWRIELEIRMGVFLITTYFFVSFVYIIMGGG